MRLWDAGTSEAAGRLAQVQDVLEHLWETAPKDQPIFVRNARWLIPLAQSPTTDELAGYFAVAEQIAKSFSEEDRNEILRAGIRMAGGHLRTQLRHVSLKRGVSFDDRSVVSSTRTSNALDVAMLIQSLVPILEAYEFACDSGFNQKRLDLAATICQGISPDPELFLNRLDLLGPYSMIEYLFITTDGDGDGQVVYTPMGQRHIQRLQKYEDLIRRLRKPLLEDCPRFRPVDGVYSPYGVIFGYSYNLIEHMALKSLRPDIETHFSLEDVFTEGDADKRAWVSGWRKLPHIKPEVTKLFEYPQQFAEDIFARIEQALQQGVSDSEKNAAVHTGLLFILPADGPNTDSPAWQIPDLPPEYIRSSDQQFAASRNTASYNESDLSHSRLEGEFLVSYKSTGGWVAISKDALTEVLGAGQDVKLVGLPPAAAEVVKGMCRDLVVTE
jgi:hypothetical protein